MATISQIEIKGVLYDIKDTTARQDTGTELDTAMSDTSENGVQNKVVKAYVDDAITTESITNTLGYKPADQEDVSKLSKEKVSMPNDSEGAPQTGTVGQVLESAGDGTTKWADKTAVDKTLTKEGTAADAKATGDGLNKRVVKSVFNPKMGNLRVYDKLNMTCDGANILLQGQAWVIYPNGQHSDLLNIDASTETSDYRYVVYYNLSTKVVEIKGAIPPADLDYDNFIWLFNFNINRNTNELTYITRQIDNLYFNGEQVLTAGEKYVLSEVNENSSAVEEITEYLDCEFAIGNLGTDGLLDESYTTRVSSKDFLEYDRDITLSWGTPFECIVCTYNTDETLTNRTHYLSAPVNIPANTIFKVTMRKKPEETVLDVYEYNVAVTIVTDVKANTIKNSEDITNLKKVTQAKKERPKSGIVPITLNVDGKTDYGVLYLPINYTPSGQPVQLVINCHGAGTCITAEDYTIPAPASNLPDFGYAVCDINANVNAVDSKGQHWGDPDAIKSYLTLYDYVTKNYNVTKEVFISGTSMGGTTSNYLVNLTSIPVKAQAGFCTIVDIGKSIYLEPPYNYITLRNAITKSFGFTDFEFTNDSKICTAEELAHLQENADKLVGYNPIQFNCINWSTANPYEKATVSTVTDSQYQETYDQEAERYTQLIATHKCPIKIWHCADDTTVSHRYGKYYIEALKRGGCMAEFREFATGYHNAYDNAEYTQELTKIDGTTGTYNASTVELLEWFKKWK